MMQLGVHSEVVEQGKELKVDVATDCLRSGSSSIRRRGGCSVSLLVLLYVGR